MKRVIIMAALTALACVGCSNLMVPRTTIKGTIAGQPFEYSGPKDQTLEGLEIVAATNGAVTIKVQKLDAKMNPEVITMSGKVFVDSINAIGAQVISAAGATAKAAAK